MNEPISNSQSNDEPPLDQASLLNKETLGQQDYIYFRCGSGHENYIPYPCSHPSAHFDSDNLIVKCQKCQWQSPPFKPVLFQQDIASNILLWVYTSKETVGIQSTYNLFFPTIGTQQPLVKTPPAPPDDTPAPPDNNTPAPPDNNTPAPPDNNTPTPPDNNMPAPPDDTSHPIAHKNELPQIFPHLQPDSHIDTPRSSTQSSKNISDTITIHHAKKKLGDTQEISLSAYSESDNTTNEVTEIIDDTVETASTDEEFQDISEAPDVAPEIQRHHTLKIKPTHNKQNIHIISDESSTQQPTEHTYCHYFPNDIPTLKLSLPVILPFMQIILILFTVSCLGVFALQSCNEQGDKIALAIRNIQINTSIGTPTIHNTNNHEPSNDESYKKIETLTSQQTILAQKYQDIQKQFTAQSQNYEQLQEAHKTLLAQYENERQEKKEIQANLEKLNKNFAEPQMEIQKLKNDRQSIQDALLREFEVKQLEKSDQDFGDPTLDKSGKRLLFYQENVSDNTVQSNLYIADIQNSGLQLTSLFKTQSLPLNKRGIVFGYSWDGKENIVLRTRIDGKSSLYYIRIQNKLDKMPEVQQMREITNTKHPDLIGQPQISPDGRYFAVIHKIGSDFIIKIYACEDGLVKFETNGGGDSNRIPSWSLDSSKLYFLTNERTGIIEWSFANNEKRVKQIGQEIYGQYLSVSPCSKKLAFFSTSEQGKGQVHISLWNLEKNEINFLQKDIKTTENYRPAWSKESRFLAVIHDEKQDQIAIYDSTTNQKYDVVQKTGNIKWLDWTCSDNLIFSYQEGLYARPYCVQLVSWFAKN